MTQSQHDYCVFRGFSEHLQFLELPTFLETLSLKELNTLGRTREANGFTWAQTEVFELLLRNQNT